MVLVADLVTPRTEATTGPDVLLLHLGQDLGEGTLTLQRGGGVTVVEAAVVGRDDLVGGAEHLSVDETLDTLGQESLVVNGLHGRLGNLQHDGPVRTFLRLSGLRLRTIGDLEGRELLGGLGLVVGGVVGEDGGTVEGAVILGEVEPALVTDSLGTSATDTNTDDVGRRVEELLGQTDQLLVAHHLGKMINGHGGDELLVSDGGAILQGYCSVVGVHLDHGALLTEASFLLGDSVGNGNPDTTSTAAGREAESGVRTPVTGGLVQDNVGSHSLDVGGSDTLTEPSTLHLKIQLVYGIQDTCGLRLTHLGGRHSPHLVVVGSHEEIGKTATHHAHNPLIEVGRLLVGHTGLHSSIDQAINALHLVLLGKHGNVVLEGVRDPFVLATDVGDTLVAVPVIILGEGLVDAVVEVLVVGEDDVTTDIVKLTGVSERSDEEGVGKNETYETFGGHIGGSQTTRNLVVVDDQPRGAILQKPVNIFVPPLRKPAGDLRSDSNASQHPNQLGLHQ